MLGNTSNIHVEDVEELLNARDRPVVDGSVGTNENLVVVEVVFDAGFIEGRADVVKPHFDVQDEAFEDVDKLAKALSFHISQKWETVKISAFDLVPFLSHNAIESPHKFPEGRQKAELFLENGVYFRQDVQDEQRKAEMGVDQGVPKRQGASFSCPRGCFKAEGLVVM